MYYQEFSISTSMPRVHDSIRASISQEDHKQNTVGVDVNIQDNDFPWKQIRGDKQV